MSTPRKRAPGKRGAAAAASGQSQRERLLGRPRPSLAYRLLVDGDGLEQARKEHERVRVRTRQTLLRADPGSPEYRKAQRDLDKAQAAVDVCYETIVLRALPTDGEVTSEKLMAAHPPTDEQVARVKAERDKAHQQGRDLAPWPEWNDDTFPAALLAACAESDMSEQDWREFLAGHVSDGEKRGLWLAALAVNERERVADPLVLPKGLTGMLS